MDPKKKKKSASCIWHWSQSGLLRTKDWWVLTMPCRPWAYLPLVTVFTAPLLWTVSIFQKGESQHRIAMRDAWHLGSGKYDSSPHLKPKKPLHPCLLQFWSLLVIWNRSDWLHLRKVSLGKKKLYSDFLFNPLPRTSYCEESQII